MRLQNLPLASLPVVASAALSLSAAGLGPIDYVQSSTGLTFPTMEAGNTEFAFGDLNGDGHVDIAMVGDHGSPNIGSSQHGVTVWFGDGHGNWSAQQVGNFGYGGIAIGDVNGDGFLDVGYGMHHDYSGTDLGDQLLEVALGNGSGVAWTPWDDGLATNGETWGMFGTDFADVDNDGDLDIGSVSFGCCAGLHVYLNDGDGSWTQSFGFLGGNSSLQFLFGDLNGDGHADIVAAHQSGTVWLGDGHGDFTLADAGLPGGTPRTALALGDVDGDGRDDLAFSYGGGVQVWSLSPGGWVSRSGELASIGAHNRTAVADMDLDGHADVVVFKADLARVYAGDGLGHWTLASTITLPDGCDFVDMQSGVDLDHNGYPDILVAQEENCSPFTGGANRPRVYVESSAPEESFVHAVAPLPFETWVAGSIRFVDWHAALADDVVEPSISIEFSTNGTSGPWMAIASGLPSNGRFQWTVPTTVPSSTAAYVRITLGGGAVPAAFAGPFTIVGGAEPALGDLNLDGKVDAGDLAILLGAWGDCPPRRPCPADLNGDCAVDAADLAVLLGSWS